ncbi:MAG TPA: phosphatase PAP2 family protein [Solirubrobacteraceae bacterium]|jgi:membrane-associated phospholipid phosphatase
MLRRPRVLVIAAAACLVVAAVAYVAAMHVGPLQRDDVRVLSGFRSIVGARSWRAANSLSHAFDPVTFVLLAVLAAFVGVARERPRLALTAAVAMLGANLTTQLLKSALTSARPIVAGSPVGTHAWPSGHATAAMSLALALVVVSPARLRPYVAAAGGLLAVAVGYSVLLLGWHYPSDVVGGYLMAGAWTCLVAAVALRPAGAWPRPRAALAVPALVALVLLAGLAVLAARHPEEVSGRTTFVAGAAALAAGAMAIAAGVSAVLSGSGPAPTAAPGRRPPR